MVDEFCFLVLRSRPGHEYRSNDIELKRRAINTDLSRCLDWGADPEILTKVSANGTIAILGDLGNDTAQPQSRKQRIIGKLSLGRTGWHGTLSSLNTEVL